jgi:hypothetical protein
MKKLFCLITGFSSAHLAMACGVCKKQQPKLLENVTHGTGPQSNWDYVIVLAVAVLVVITLSYSLKSLIWPKERSILHIKNSIIDHER